MAEKKVSTSTTSSFATTVKIDPTKVIKVEVITQKNSLDSSKIRTLGNQVKR